MTYRLRILATLAALATVLTTVMLPAPAYSASSGNFTMNCLNPAGTSLGELTLTYQNPQLIGKNVVQTYDTIRFTPTSRATTKVSGTLKMYNIAYPTTSSKKFSISANRTTKLSWKLTVPENQTLGTSFSAQIATSGSRPALKYYATCSQS
jgi:hypothetical protein